MPSGPENSKTCNKCKQAFSVESFGTYQRRRRGRVETIVHSYCRPCKNSMHDPAAARRSVLRTRYKLEWEDFLALLESQGGGCGVCGSPEPGGKGHWHIDHDHNCCPTDSSRGIVKTCGRCVRGVLCHLCNTALGCARDDTEILAKMIAYLEDRNVR